MLALVLAWFAAVAPSAPRERALPIARAIVLAARNRTEAAMLASISVNENGVGRAGVPLGACGHLCHLHCTECHPAPIRSVARWSVGVLRAGRAPCAHAPRAGRVQCVLARYHSGRVSEWRTDHFARVEADLVDILLQMAPPSPRHARR